MIKRNRWTEEELKLLKDNYCSGIKYVEELLLTHTYLSIKKKAKFLGLKVIRLATEDIREAVKDSYNFSEVFRKLDKSKSGDSYKIIKRIIEENRIDTSHFDPYKGFAKNLVNNEIPIDVHLSLGTIISSNNLKNKLYKKGLKQRICEKCGQDENWKGEKMSLILDHINGVSNDNRLENLRILCPNCNATLETHCKGYKKIKAKIRIEKIEKVKLNKHKEKIEFGFTDEQRISQKNQRKVERPSYKDLKEEIINNGYSATGRKYNVSDNTIRKWKKIYEKYGENF